MLAESSLRDLYVVATTTEDRDDCLSAETLTAVATREATEVERDRALDHIATCSHCAQELRTLRTLKPWAREVVRELPLSTRPTLVPEGGPSSLAPPTARRATSWPRQALLAAGLAAVVLGGFFFGQSASQSADPRRDVLRGTAEATVRPAPDARLHEAPSLFTWVPEQGATSYRLRLFDAGARTLWESRASAETFAKLPADVRANLQPGRSFLWTVEIRGDVQTQTAGPFWFHLEAPSKSR